MVSEVVVEESEQLAKITIRNDIIMLLFFITVFLIRHQKYHQFLVKLIDLHLKKL